MSDIHENMVPTERMLRQLEADPNFNIENTDDPNAVIPIFAWRLWVRAPNQSGKMEIVKGPHYNKSFIKIGDATKWPRAYLFRISKRLICATFSRDLDFDETQKYKLDCNKGEIYAYPAFIDDVGPLG